MPYCVFINNSTRNTQNNVVHTPQHRKTSNQENMNPFKIKV